MILITGASSGLGCALAKQYDQDGEQLVLSGRDQQKLADVVAKLTNQATGIACDLSCSQQVTELFDSLEETPNTIVHCAGSGSFGSLQTQQSADIESLISNNLTSSIYLLQEIVKRYQDLPVNVVVVMSTAAQVAKAGESTYCAVKWAVRALLESLRLELKGKPIKLIAVYPGGMATEFWKTSGKQMDTSSFISPDDAAKMLKQALVSAEHGFVSDITINRG